MWCSNLFGQAGTLNHTTPVPSTNPLALTCHQFDVNWVNLQFSTGKRYNIEVFLTGGCINTAATLASIPAEFQGLTPQGQPMITFPNTSSIRISRISTTAFSMGFGNYLPLMTIFYEAAPGSTVSTSLIFNTFRNAANQNYTIGNNGFPFDFTMPTALNLGGFVKKTNPSTPCTTFPQIPNNGINGVTVSITASPNPSQCTQFMSPASQLFLDGNYLFSVPPRFNYTITPTKMGTDWCCGVETDDVNEARKIYNDLVSGGSGLYPLYQVLAADFFPDNQITNADPYFMDRCLREIFDPSGGVFATSSMWRFIPALSYSQNDPWTISGNLSLLPSSIVTGTLNGNSPSNDFIGVKRGDLDQNCSDCGSNFTGGSEDRGEGSLSTFFIKDQSVETGQEILLPVYFSETSGFAVFKTELSFNTDYLQVTGVEKGILSNEYGGFEINGDGSSLLQTYFNLVPSGEDLKTGEIAYFIKAIAKQSSPTLNGLVSQKTNPVDNTLFTLDGDFRSSLQFEIQNNAPERFRVQFVGKNPVESSSNILVELPEAGQVEATLLSQTGQISWNINENKDKGANLISLPDFPTQTGIYTLVVKSQFGQKIIRLTKI